jgi:hypothetical protein
MPENRAILRGWLDFVTLDFDDDLWEVAKSRQHGRTGSWAKGGRKDVRLILHYDRVPSLLGSKNWLPRRLQREARFRRDSHQVVS